MKAGTHCCCCSYSLCCCLSINLPGSCTPLSASCALVACYPRGAVVGLLSGELVMALMYYAAWVWLMARSGRLLRLRPWQKCRTANTIFRLEVSFGGVASSGKGSSGAAPALAYAMRRALLCCCMPCRQLVILHAAPLLEGVTRAVHTSQHVCHTTGC